MKRQFILILSLCLIFASPSLADFSLRYDPVVEVGDGLWSYQVYITGTNQFNSGADYFSNINVSDNAVQFSFGIAENGTVLDTDITSGPGIDQSYLAKDTHLITLADCWFSILKGGATESNDGSIHNIFAGPWDVPHILGNGPITTIEDGAYSFEAQTGDIHFLQVVLEGGNAADVSVQVLGGMVGNVASISLPAPPVPEPSTIVMLVLGGLCLLVCRKNR
jgi:PEP-CTERM motif